MGYTDYLKDLLRPLRVYKLEGSYNGGELTAQGEALDKCALRLEEVQREMLISTAQGPGLEAVESLLARRPVTHTLERRRPQRRSQRDRTAGTGGGALSGGAGSSGGL